VLACRNSELIFATPSKDGTLKYLNTNEPQKYTTVWPFVWLSVLASVLIAGCSSSPPPVSPVYRDPCLDDGPVKSAAYETCVEDREFDKALAYKALFEDLGPSFQPKTIVEPGEDEFQSSDFPDIEGSMAVRVTPSISAIEKQALPFKVRVIWKYVSKTFRPRSRDLVRMDEMEALILPAVEEKGLAKWVCTLTGEKRRVWTFYTRSDDAFIARVQAALAPSGPYPIELSAGKEPAWRADELTADNLHREIRITPKRCVE
jgi:hypothetical protein